MQAELNQKILLCLYLCIRTFNWYRHVCYTNLFALFIKLVLKQWGVKKNQKHV